MDSLRVGRSIRALRIRQDLRQADLAGLAGLSRTQVARIERGELQRIPLGDLGLVVTALRADLDLRVRWHGEGLDRLLDAAHAALVERLVALLGGLGWECAVEVSFNVAGERGSIDVLAWHAPTATLLVVEVKTVVPDAQGTLSAHDRKARLGRTIARARGWDPAVVARLLVVADGATSRRRVSELALTFDSAYPARSWAVPRWLKAPTGPLAGLLFLSYGRAAVSRRTVTGRQRVRRPIGSRAGS